MKWLGKALRGAHRVVPYLALALSLAGAPECAALLQSVVPVVAPAPDAALLGLRP